MVADPALFRDLAYVLVAAVLGGAAAWLARQPLILGYVAGGILISPLTPGPSVSHIHTFEAFAEVGVILLMFSIGIEFSLRDLLRVKWVALIGGPLGILLSVLLSLAVGTALGWSVLQSTVVGLVVSVASTMVMARLLMDRGELSSRHGRIMIGITLVEDLAVVVLIVLIPRLGTLDGERLLAIAGGLGRAVAILVPLVYLSAKVLPPLLKRVARAHNQELFLLVTLAIAIGTAVLTQAAGLSLALGAFLAGLLISGSDYAHEALARLLPLRDVFVALFFVTVGVLLNPSAVAANLPLLAVIVGLVVVGKLVIWTAVVLVFRQPIWTALLVAVGLTQIGEFSYVLIRVARDAGHVGDDVYNATLAASLLTILANAALVRIVPRWIGRARLARGRESGTAGVQSEALAGHVVLCGFGRVGSAVAEALEAFGTPYVAVERDPDIVQNLRSRGVPCLFGDAANRHILETAGTARAALVIVALPEIEAVGHAVREARSLNPGVPVLARAHEATARARLSNAGAAAVVEPEAEAAAALIQHALGRLALPPERILAYLERFRYAMEATAAAEAPAAGAGLPHVVEVAVESGSLVHGSLRDGRIRERFGVTVVAVRRADGDVVLNPSAETVLRPGDHVRVFGLPSQIAAFLQDLRAPA